MIFQECCGYAAAFVSCVAFGSFAVPIKCHAVQKVDVDPLGTLGYSHLGKDIKSTCDAGHSPSHVVVVVVVA